MSWLYNLLLIKGYSPWISTSMGIILLYLIICLISFVLRLFKVLIDETGINVLRNCVGLGEFWLVSIKFNWFVELFDEDELDIWTVLLVVIGVTDEDVDVDEIEFFLTITFSFLLFVLVLLIFWFDVIFSFDSLLFSFKLFTKGFGCCWYESIFLLIVFR